MNRIVLSLLFLSVSFAQNAQKQILLADTDAPVTPTDSPGGGTYGSTQSVTLADATATFILYTTNGSTPACPATGTLYSGAISVTVTTTIKAIGCNGVTGSGVLTSVYTITGSHTFTLVQQVNADTSVCTSGTTCTLTVASTGSGNLLVITTTQFSGAANYISSVSGGGTWVVGTTNFQLNNACCGAVSSAYVLSSSSGTTSVVITWNGTFAAQAVFREFSFTGGGAVSIDASGTAFDSPASTSNAGPTLTLSGTSDAIAQQAVCEVTPSGISLSYTDTFFPGFAGHADKLNTNSGTGPVWTTTSTRCIVGALAFK